MQQQTLQGKYMATFINNINKLNQNNLHLSRNPNPNPNDNNFNLKKWEDE
jgi:hypothetical protein